MKTANLIREIPEGTDWPCECEHGNCVHPTKEGPCVYFAIRGIMFHGAGTFNLCDSCTASYIMDGYVIEGMSR